MESQIYEYKKEELKGLKEKYKEQLSSIKYSAIGYAGFGGIGAVAQDMFKEIPHGPEDAFMAYGIFGMIALWAGADAVCNALYALKTKKKIRRLERQLENDTRK